MTAEMPTLATPTEAPPATAKLQRKSGGLDFSRVVLWVVVVFLI